MKAKQTARLIYIHNKGILKMAQDDTAEARRINRKYYGNPDGLAKYLVQISANRTSVVIEVFRQLNTYSSLHVGCRFMTKISSGELQGLARTSSGLVLCRKLLHSFSYIWTARRGKFSVMSVCPNWHPHKIRQILQAAIRMAKYGSELKRAGIPRQLSKDEMEYYAKYNKTSKVRWEMIRKNYEPNRGPRNIYDPNVCWELPSKGIGFETYNRDDLHRKSGKKRRKTFDDKYGYDQIGTQKTIFAMIRIARKWHTKHPNRLLQYGDISRSGGINTPDHKTHNNGKAFDMRPLRNDSKIGDSAKVSTPKDPAYDQGLTKAFILLVIDLYPKTTFYFNDKQLNEIDPKTRMFVGKKGGHNNHLHVMFSGGN